MTPRQEARRLLRPLFERPVSPQERQVCDQLTALLITRNHDAEKMQDQIDDLKKQLDELHISANEG